MIEEHNETIMRLIEFIDTFQEFLIKLLKAFLSTSIVYLPIILCKKLCIYKMRFNAYKREREREMGRTRQNNCWSSCWWSAKNIDYRDNTAKHFHSAQISISFVFVLAFAFAPLASHNPLRLSHKTLAFLAFLALDELSSIARVIKSAENNE